MSFHDAKVAKELGLEFEECYPEVSPNDPNTVLFDQYVTTITASRQRSPALSAECADCDEPAYGWPTYLLVSKQGETASVLAKYQGAAPKAKFREIISELIQAAST